LATDNFGSGADVKLEFRLLGDIAVLADGQPLELGGTRQRSVLALLLLQRDRPIATELLVDRLWPDDQPLTAIKTIQVYVSRIRHALGPAADRLTSSATGYRLAVADDELDAARFERGLRQAREALAAGSPDAAVAGLEESLAAWSGSALGDLAGEQFARREADRLEELRLQAFEELFELRIAGGSGRETIGELRRLVGEQPGRERLWRLLMLALYADGRQGEALEAYQDARRYLADELGLDPSPELAELERAILTQEAPRARGSLVVTTALMSDTVAPAFEHGVAADSEPVVHRTRRVVTVLRVDVARASDDELDPELLEAIDRRVLDVVRRAVERHGGTIERADHDGVTAVFGRTVAREDDALRAIRAAAELRAADVAFRVGVATGEVISDPPDAHGSTLIGHPLRVAPRLAAHAAMGEVLLAADTAALVRGATSTEPLPAGRTDIETGSSAVRLVALTEGDPIVRRTTTPFVGRTAELDGLAATFARTVSGGMPGLVTVIGAPGVGKSRLVAEAFARISERATILRSRCLPYGDGITYWPVRELVMASAGIAPGEQRETSLAKLGTVVAGLDRGDLVRSRIAAVVGLSDDAVPGEEIPWAARRLFEALAAERPLVLLVDDLQWAESSLLDLLEHVMDLGRGPILLVTVARPELEEVRPDWFARSSHLLVRLDSLDESDAATLLDHLAPELPPGPLRSRILATAEGNPLFVEQFVGYAADELDVDGPGLDHRTSIDLSIPPTIGALLAARLDRLPDVERRVLERAAVVGRTFWAGALAELLPGDERLGLAPRLARLARRDLIRPERSEFVDDEAYRFRHLLIRDAAYAALPKSERAELHERFAGWLEQRSGANSGEYDLILGYHLEQAYWYLVELGDDRADTQLLADRALLLLAPAARAAQERGDTHATASLLRRAVDLAPSGPQRIELLLDLRRALQTAGEGEASDAADAEAVALMARYPNEELAHRRGLTEAHFTVDGTTPEARDAYAYYKRVGDRLGMIRALEITFATYASRGEVTSALELREQATALALEIGRPDRARWMSTRAATALSESPVPVPEALDRCWRYLDLAPDDRVFRAFILIAIGELEASSGVRDRWRRHFDAAKAIIDDLGLQWPLGASTYPIKLGSAELAAGEPTRTVELLRSSCSILDRLGDLSRLATVAPLTAQTLLAVGQPDEVEHYAFWGRDIAVDGDLDAQARWRIAISGLRSQQGHHDEAIAMARESVAVVAPSEFVVLSGLAHMTLARALKAAGDEPAAVAAAREAQRLASAKQDQAALRKIEAFLAPEG
jgi:DNA-binding SARP family transcriptional activator